MIYEELKNNAYPGRGIILGKSESGKEAVIAYFIMGRSENSRNRIFIENDGVLHTEAFEPSKLIDPSLIIYNAVRKIDDGLIVTNGNQTDTIYDYLNMGKSFEDALNTREFEPDSPNYTPRISGLISVKENNLTYKLSILKSFDGDNSVCIRNFFNYSGALNGTGHLIHTYNSDGSPIPSFSGEPKRMDIVGDIDTYSIDLWNSLNEDNRVSLVVKFVSIESGETETRIINKNMR